MLTKVEVCDDIFIDPVCKILSPLSASDQAVLGQEFVIPGTSELRKYNSLLQRPN